MIQAQQISEELISRGFSTIISSKARDPMDAVFAEKALPAFIYTQHGSGETHSKLTTLLARETDIAGQKLVIDQTDQLVLRGAPSDRIRTIVEFVEHGRDLYARVTHGGQQISDSRAARSVIDNTLKLMSENSAVLAA